MKYDVITIGAAVSDVYLQSDEFQVEDSDRFPGSQNACFILGGKIEIDKPHFSSGGGATNAAASFAHLGLKTATIAKIGNDDAGQTILNDIKNHGVHTSLIVKSDDESTGYSVLLTAASGQRTAVVYRGASKTLNIKDIPWKQINARWFYISSLGGDIKLVKKIFDFAASNDIKIAWNPGSLELKHGERALKPLIKQADVFSLNREETSQLTGTMEMDLRGLINKMSEYVGGIFLLTDVKNGTYACRDRECFHALPTNVEVVNATGSGDAFGSGFTTGLITTDGDIITALKLGTLNAESVIQKVGAKIGILKRIPGSRVLASIKIEPYRI